VKEFELEFAVTLLLALPEELLCDESLLLEAPLTVSLSVLPLDE